MPGDLEAIDPHIESLERIRNLDLDAFAFKLPADQEAASVRIIGERTLTAL